MALVLERTVNEKGVVDGLSEGLFILFMVRMNYYPGKAVPAKNVSTLTNWPETEHVGVAVRAEVALMVQSVVVSVYWKGN